MKYILLFAIAILFFSCKSDLKSPIDIRNTEKNDKNINYFVDYFEVNQLNLINNFTHIDIQLNDESNFVTISDSSTYSGLDFKLQNISIYSPSLHSINQKHYAAEIIFFHKDTLNNNLIISLFVDKGNENIQYQPIINNLPNRSASIKLDETLDLLNLLPQQTHFYIYQGSTIEKVIEPAKWIILKDNIEFSEEQLTKLQSKISRADIKQVVDENINVIEY